MECDNVKRSKRFINSILIAIAYRKIYKIFQHRLIKIVLQDQYCATVQVETAAHCLQHTEHSGLEVHDWS